MATSPPPDRFLADASSAVAAYPHGRVPREVRRRQIVALAEALFGERGFQAASMDELARRAGVSKPVIYDLVGSKEELFHEVMARESADLAARVEAAVEAEPVREQKLHAGALAFFRFAAERRSSWALLMAPDAATVTAEVASARRFQARQVSTLLARAAADEGALLDPLLLDACAHAINGAFEALASWWQDHPEIVPEALATLATGLLLPGLLALDGTHPGGVSGASSATAGS